MATEITIFAKKRRSKDGKKTFLSYLTTLTKKDGTTETVSVRFREDCGDPKEFPCNVIVNKEDMNISRRQYIREDTGEAAEAKTLWITAWEPGSEYVDHSMDDYNV